MQSAGSTLSIAARREFQFSNLLRNGAILLPPRTIDDDEKMRQNQPSLSRRPSRTCFRLRLATILRCCALLPIGYIIVVLRSIQSYEQTKSNKDYKSARYEEPTMPPRVSSANTAGFVHIGKTGGSSISTLLRNGCTSFVAGPCRNITHETAVSKYVEHYYHVPDFWRLPETKHEAFIISVRDPFDRSVSSLLYHHPQNAEVYHLRQTQKQLYFGPLAYACFPTLESFAQLMHGNSSNCNYPYRQNSIVADDCTGLACAVIHGKVRLFSHLFFNYRNILDTKLPSQPPRRVYILRQEFLWDDWKIVNDLLGQKAPVVIPNESDNWRNISGIKLPVSREISEEGRHKLCRALESEFMAYFRILKKAINIDQVEFEKSVQIAETNCPNIAIRSMIRHG